MIVVSKQDVDAFVIGGAVLGGGGGGSITEGLKIGKTATEIATIKIIDPSEIENEKTVITVSAVGVQSKGEIEKEQYIRSVELLRIYGISVDALISSECGAIGTVNGWIQSAILKIPVLDAPCDGRAHPTGLMGSMGLHRLDNFISIQSAVGMRIGDNFSEILVKGKLEDVSRLIRMFSKIAGGMVAVARNPISAEYVIKNGAPGALSLSRRIGEAILTENNPYDKVKAAMKVLGGTVICEGIVTKKTLNNESGFDVGTIEVTDTQENAVYKISFVNEYMTLETQGKHLATFPDLIDIFNLKNGLPLNSAEVRENNEVVITLVNKEKLILGAGLKYPEVYNPIKTLLEKEIGQVSFI